MPPVPTRGARAKPTRKTTARPGSENGADGLNQTQLNRLVTALEAAADGDFSVRCGPTARSRTSPPRSTRSSSGTSRSRGSWCG